VPAHRAPVRGPAWQCEIHETWPPSPTSLTLTPQTCSEPPTSSSATISWRRRRSFHERPQQALPESSAADPVEGVGLRDGLWHELAALPPRQRAAIVLRYYEDLSESRTAELMGCSVGTVKSQVSAGLTRLRTRAGADVFAPEADGRTVTP